MAAGDACLSIRCRMISAALRRMEALGSKSGSSVRPTWSSSSSVLPSMVSSAGRRMPFSAAARVISITMRPTWMSRAVAPCMPATSVGDLAA